MVEIAGAGKQERFFAGAQNDGVVEIAGAGKQERFFAGAQNDGVIPRTNHANTLFSQFGRSMTEMLGVLAIVGVLSIAAILGYSYAIDKYRTNETLQELTRRYIVLNDQYSRRQVLNQSEFGAMTTTGYPVQAGLMTDEELGLYQELSQVPSGVCRQIIKADYPAVLSVNGAYLGSSPALCADENVVRFEYVGDAAWCVKLDENGNCCDTQGRCCPSSKPMINSSGVCVPCEGAQSINLGSYAYTCARCENRALVSGTNTCAKVCPDGEYRDSGGNCHKCDEVWGGWIDASPYNLDRIRACPKMVLSNNVTTSYGTAAHCDRPDQSISSETPAECAKCENRELVFSSCAKVCPDGQYRDSGGNCHKCEDIWGGWIDTTPYNLDRIRACPKMVLSGGATNNKTAAHCDRPDQSIGSETPAECAKCENRVLQGSNCVLK